MSDGRHSKRRGAIKVFLSHSNVDTEVARKVRNLLVHRTSAQVFMSEDLNAGEKWETKLRNELASADVVLALLTPQSVDSSWVLLEIGAAWALEKPIIPVITRRDVLNKMPVSLEGTRTIALSDITSAENAGKFVAAFEDSLSTSQIA
ncbi:MAG TPA: toll/interleukin-1 receptor domain-containing protein [Bryobacteraceae bacterium]|nr:toll/interleukin-1 receptor domain-containing protein [Bryobacteraceae bacterium]